MFRDQLCSFIVFVKHQQHKLSPSYIKNVKDPPILYLPFCERQRFPTLKRNTKASTTLAKMWSELKDSSVFLMTNICYSQSTSLCHLVTFYQFLNIWSKYVINSSSCNVAFYFLLCYNSEEAIAQYYYKCFNVFYGQA